MKTILTWKRHLYPARVGTLLIAVALIAGMVVGCNGGEAAPVYTLTIDCTYGGTVVVSFNGTDGEPLGVRPLGVYPTEFVGASYGTSSEIEWDFGDGETNSATMTPTHNYAMEYITPTDEAGLLVELTAIPYASADFAGWSGDVDTVEDPDAAITTMRLNGDYHVTANFGYNRAQVVAGAYHTVGVRDDGTAVACGLNDVGQCDVDDWEDILLATAGTHHTAALVYAGDNGGPLAKPLYCGVYPTEFMGASIIDITGNNSWSLGDIADWSLLTQIAAGADHIAACMSDGTVVAAGDNSEGQCNVDGWYDITQVSTGGAHSVGLQSPSKVVATGDNSFGQCNVGNWTGIFQVAAGGLHTVGLGITNDAEPLSQPLGVYPVDFTGFKCSGAGANSHGQRNVDDWTNIVQCAAGGLHTVGLKTDGTVVATGDNSYDQCEVSEWTDIIQVAAGDYHTVGLCSDGSVVATGLNDDGQCEVSGWNLFESPWDSTITLECHLTVPSATTSLAQYVYLPWIAELEAITGTSGGNFEVNVTYGDTPYAAPDSLTAISLGVVDIGQLSPETFKLGGAGYLPWKFTSIESAAYTMYHLWTENDAVWDTNGELSDVKILLSTPLWGAQYWGHSVNITVPADMAGLDVRAESGEFNTILALGAIPVNLSTSDLAVALDLDVVQGCFFTYSGIDPAFGLGDVTSYTTELNMFYRPYALAMNLEMYNALPSEARAALDSICGVSKSVDLATAHLAAEAADKADTEADRPIYTPSPGGMGLWTAAVASVDNWWAGNMTALGFNGTGILTRIDELIVAGP